MVEGCDYMTITQGNWLDVGNLLINELVGSFWLTFVLGLVLITFLAVRSNVKEQVLVLFLMLYSVGMSAYYTSSVVLAVVGLVISFLIYGGLSKVLK